MPTPTETVMAFFAECGKGKSAMMNAFRSYFSSKTVWELVGSATTRGIDEAVAKVASTQASHGMECLVSDILAIVAKGGSVLTERVDNVRATDGSNLASCRCMGIFDVDDGKIIAWREYYDTKTYG